MLSSDANDPTISVRDLQPSTEAFYDEVVRGLQQSPKQLPCKYFYDDEGCRLFDAICELDEYYPTRTEIEIMDRCAGQMADWIGARCMLIELGSGSSIKTRILLDHLHDAAAYVPVDIARDHLEQTAHDLAEDYPRLAILPICADFTDHLQLPQIEPAASRKVIYFPGSTIGNFSAPAASALLQQMADTCGTNGGLLIGIDLEKDVDVLEAAYNDRSGVTAAFNLNLLYRINRELNADFQIDQFAHHSFYNATQGRIEMHLVSKVEQTVQIHDQSYLFRKGETICTEHSHKYRVNPFAQLAQSAGWRLDRQWTDPQRWFAVLGFRTDAG